MAEQSFTCKWCGGQFNGRKRLYCTTKCREEKRRRLKGISPRQPAACHQTHTCFWCASTFKPKRKGRDKYCSRKCFFAFKAARSALMDQMSASHKVIRNRCETCNSRFSSRQNARFCSWLCYEMPHHEPKIFECGECGSAVLTSYGDKRSKFCSDACRRRNNRRIRRKVERARLREVQVERVDPIKVFDRDGWRCQICGTKTQKAKRGKVHPRAPELDHIIPLSVGGEHSYKNTQCACRECNGKKGNDVYGQIPMFAT